MAGYDHSGISYYEEKVGVKEVPVAVSELAAGEIYETRQS